MNLEFHRLAELELNEAAQFYDGETPGLGLSFIREVERCLQLILENPHGGPVIGGTVRRRLVRRFPYALLYKVHSDSIRLLAADRDRWPPEQSEVV